MAAPARDINPTLQDAVKHFVAVNSFVDVASVHTYPGDDQNGYIYGTNETEYLRPFAEAAASMNKPLMIGEFGDNLEIHPYSNFSVEVLSAAFSLKIPVALMWEWMVPSDRDPSTRLVWSVDPNKTPFMTSLLQRFSVAAQTGTWLRTLTTKTETATKTLTVQSTITVAIADQTTVLSTVILGMAFALAVANTIHLRKRLRNRHE